jgi:S-adenosylmethionine-dependent methyltransferase
MSTFAPGEVQWIARLGDLRNTVRQELMRRQLAEHARSGMQVLDVGCGQGTQAIELARLGCHLTGVEPSAELRARCEASAADSGVVVRVLDGTIESLSDVLRGETFDLVCAHGLLMYLPDRTQALSLLSRSIRPGGQLSVTFRNGHALAMRPGMRRDWNGALAAFGSRDYVNELGVPAKADLIEEVTADLNKIGLEVINWYGVRVFNDPVAADTPVPTDEDMRSLLEVEDRAGRLDPYRWMASMIHLVATSPQN